MVRKKHIDFQVGPMRREPLIFQGSPDVIPQLLMVDALLLFIPLTPRVSDICGNVNPHRQIKIRAEVILDQGSRRPLDDHKLADMRLFQNLPIVQSQLPAQCTGRPSDPAWASDFATVRAPA